MLYTPLTNKAMRIAYAAHHGQTDKSGQPYIFHPLHLAEQMEDEVSACVALLHDVAEDTDVTLEELAREEELVFLCGHYEGIDERALELVATDYLSIGDYVLTGGELPTVYTVDLRQELQEGNRSIFSRKLQELMTDRLNKGQQTILFLNRRGYAGFVSCRSCGEVMKCPHCDVSLSEHKGGRLICHYCGYTQPMPKLCPKCGSKYILGFKAGTQQIEEKLKELYPGVRTLRMDADTTRTKDSYEKILSSFANGEADVLIGTQMIVKGHDFPKVTLVGILAADLSLNASDYRAGERTFQLLTQAVGRAGRGVLPGEAVIQTYQPDHYAITCAAAQDYESFYQEEILYRELSGYPPVAHMLAVQIYGKEEENVKQLALRLTDVVKSNMDFLSGKQKEQSNKKIQVLGPAPCQHQQDQ